MTPAERDEVRRAISRHGTPPGSSVAGATGAGTPETAPTVLALSAGARRAPFVVVVLVMLALGLMGQLMLNTSQQRGSFRLHDMQAESARLAEVQQVLEQELAQRESPGALADAARGLGMVPSGAPVFLQLSDGSVQGTPTAAPTPTPTVTATTPAPPGGSPTQPTVGQPGVTVPGPLTDAPVPPAAGTPSIVPPTTAVGATA